MKTIYTLAFSFVLLLQQSFGQPAAQQVLKKEVRLRPYIIENQVKTFSEFLKQPIAKTDLADGRFVRLIRFGKALSKTQRLSLEASGLRFEGYIPYNAYLISFPTDYNRADLASFNPIQSITLSPENKISKPLAAGRAAREWKSNDQLELLVECYLSISQQVIEKKLGSFGKFATYGTHRRTYAIATAYKDLEALINQPFVKYVEIAPGTPIPDDTKGRSLHRSNAINTDYLGGLKYDGRGVSVALADDGHVGPHIDFTGRMTSFTQSNNGTHGDMTSGICMGAGNLDPRYKGMATGSYLYLFDIGSYPQINNAIQNLANLKTVITSTSYSQGCNEYTTNSADGDFKLFNNKPLSFVFSGGNNGTGNCGYGAGAGWGNITGGYKNGKNTIATGNVDPSGSIDPTSSRGPAPDGRIKPDICANGLQQMSTDENNTYSEGGGTSAACPGLAGITAQLYQAWREIKQDANPDGALMKGILLNTADDLGNPGPDFTYGWGRVNARKALKTIQENRYYLDSLQDGDSLNLPLVVPANARNLKVMIYWADPAGEPNSEINLVNNLDLKLVHPNGSFALPWKLKTNPVASALSAPAGTGVDSLNNVEQVNLDTPEAGLYMVRVKGTSVVEGPQRFYILYQIEGEEITVTYPIGGEGFVPGQQEVIRWDAVGTEAPFNLAYSADSGVTWVTITNPVATARQTTWNVPSTFVSGKGLVKVTRGAVADVSDHTFCSIAAPSNLRVTKACADSVTIAWNAVNGAPAYQVMILGEKYMDSVGTTTATELKVPYNFSQTLWYSVCVVFPNGNKGRNAVARQRAPGLLNCLIAHDAQVSRTLAPAAGVNYNCTGLTNFPVRVMLRNRGFNPLSNIHVKYRLNSNPFVFDSAAITIQPGDSAAFQFTTGLTINPNVNYKLTVVTAETQDFNTLNDSSIITFSTTAAPVATLSQNFQSSLFPPSSWSLNNFGFTTWVRSQTIIGPTGGTTNAAKMDNFATNQNGSKDYLNTPPLDLSVSGTAILTFDRSYAPRLNRRDSLLVWVSTDCGLTFTPTGYAKDHNQLATSPTQSTTFAPTSENQWDNDTINLTPFVGGQAIVRFVSVSRFGNVLYVDNVRLTTSPVAINQAIASKTLLLYPNPAQDAIRILVPEKASGNAVFNVYGSDGRQLYHGVVTSSDSHIIPILNLPTGVYQVVVQDGVDTWQGRFMKR